MVYFESTPPPSRKRRSSSIYSHMSDQTYEDDDDSYVQQPLDFSFQNDTEEEETEDNEKEVRLYSITAQIGIFTKGREPITIHHLFLRRTPTSKNYEN